jgi:hypothetical protein
VKQLCASLILLAVAASVTASAQEAPVPGAPAEAQNDGRHDFDFFIGSWTVANRLQNGKGDWREFSTSTADRAFIDNMGNMDEMTLPKGHHGISLRFFDPQTKEWSIYWAKSPTGVLETPPVVGHFENGVGKFYSDDVDADKKPVKVRYTWTHPAGNEAHWNMAFSHDAGATWELIWTMDFTRTAPGAAPAAK